MKSKDSNFYRKGSCLNLVGSKQMNQNSLMNVNDEGESEWERYF